MQIPVNIFTGYLGAGKTTIIMNLLQQIPRPEKVVWLKNEYGDVNVDKLMLQTTHVQVRELLNGCLCCVLVGRLGTALQEILDNYQPERILIETSGTAYPGPIVWEINRIPRLRIDSVVSVVDAENFSGYEDKSYAAKLQSKVNDLIIINKYPKQSTPKEEAELEKRLDDVYELNPHVPKIKSTDGKVPAELIFGIDANSLSQLTPEEYDSLDEDPKDREHNHEDEVESFTIRFDKLARFEAMELENYLAELKGKGFIRIKGAIIDADGMPQLVNWVFGRNQFSILDSFSGEQLLVFMGKNTNQLKEQVIADLSSKFDTQISS